MFFTTERLFLSNSLSTSSIIIVFIVWADTFFLPISSNILPADPTIICGFAFKLSICLLILALPIKAVEVISKEAACFKSFIVLFIWIASSWVGARIMHCISFLLISIFSKVGRR